MKKFNEYSKIINKYSKKCGIFISKRKIINNIDLNQQNILFLKKIYDTIKITDNNYKNIFELKKTKLNKIVDKKEYPIIYQLFIILKNNNQLKRYLKKTLKYINVNEIQYIVENINMFNFFYYWYNKNHYRLDPILINPNYLPKIIREKIDLQNNTRLYLNKICYDNLFISLDIQRYIEINEFNHFQYKYKNLIINIFLPINKNIQINNIFHICFFMSKIAGKEEFNLELNIVLTKIRKEIDLDQPEKILCPIHINSGCSNIRINTICIWREEELEKVLIHELVHFFKLDLNHISFEYDNLYNKINNFFNINGYINLNEAYTELLTIIIHSLYITYKLNLPFDSFKEVLIYEINFSLFQCYKIFNYFDIHDIKNFFNINHNKNKKTINQTTDVFSYYFIKTLLFLMLNETISFIKPNFYFNGKFDDFFELISDLNKWQNFYQKLIFFRHHFNESYNKFIFKTLRMSCLQLNLFE